MPRYRRPRQATVKVPKVKVVKPRTSELSMIYKGYLSADEGQRLAALSYAVLWYDKALEYVLTKNLIPASGFKEAVDKAAKCRERALGTNFPHERDTSFRMALKLYEKACEKLSPVKLEPYLTLYEKKQEAMEFTAKRLEARFGQGLLDIQKAMGLPFKTVYCQPCNRYSAYQELPEECKKDHQVQEVPQSLTELKVFDGPNPRRFEPTVGALVYNRAAADLIRQTARVEGPLVAVLKEWNNITKAAAYQKDSQGKWLLNPELLQATRDQAVYNLISWLQSSAAPNRLVRRGVLPVQVGANNAPRAVLGAPKGTPRKRGGPFEFTPGSTRRMAYDALADGQWHELKDLKASVPRFESLLKDVEWRGKKDGLWTIETQGSQVRLVKN